jgi:hypothetical protein
VTAPSPASGTKPSSSYRLIWHAARDRQQIVFTYNNRPREACPLILGYSATGEEVVFAYQFAGGTSKGKLPEWRCFRVAAIHDLKARSGRWFEGTSHRTSQACVTFVDVDVNISATLTGPRPLAFGAAELRPPRSKM